MWVGLLSQAHVAPEDGPSAPLAASWLLWRVIIPPQPETVQFLDGALRHESFCKLGDIVPSFSIALTSRRH